MTYFGTRLRYLRKQDGLSQQQLADVLGTAKSSISMYENGHREPSFEVLEQFADYFNVPISTFFADGHTPSTITGHAKETDHSYAPVSTPSAIGYRIRTRREERGLTPKEVAKRAYLPLSTITQYERGDFDFIDPDVTYPLARVLATSHDYLVGKTDDPFYPDVGESLLRALREPQDTNVIRTVGRDGSIVEREVTDEQMALFRSMLDQFRPVTDENI